uniref:Reverse transcriptase domain-containing protein n=1 Tax=Tanacetum cinerariifolium TaxID=118510 RepID=A0A6L2P2V1_TANCI|nr:reverse transcriptase domain-containing protein [Tanacetum cinerariifolium]
MKSAYYPNFGLELLVPEQMWIDEVCTYDIISGYGISYWWFSRQKFYIDRHDSPSHRREVKKHMRILSVVRIKAFSRYGYNYLSEIVLRRSNFQEHMIAEKDFKNLYPNDFEDMNLLLLQGYLDHYLGSNKLDIEKVAVCSSLGSLKPKSIIESRAKSEDENPARANIKQALGRKLFLRWNLPDHKSILTGSVEVKMKMEIPCSIGVYFITACPYSTDTSKELMKVQVVLRIFPENLPEHPSDTKVFTMKMEILLEPTSNKLLVGLDLLLWGDLRMIFDLHENVELWMNQLDWKLLRWKLHENCGVHTLFMDGAPMEINMLVEKKYTLIKELLEKMLNLQLVAKEETFMHGNGHPKLTKKLNDKIPKIVDEMFKRVKAFIRGEVVAGSAEMVCPSHEDKGGNVPPFRNNRPLSNHGKGRKNQNCANGIYNNKMSFTKQCHNRKDWNEEPQKRDFANSVKAIALPQDVLSTSDRPLIELENQVQHLMEAYFAPTQPTQVNKITTSCEICSGPHDTQYFMEDLKQAFVEYASSHTNEARGRGFLSNANTVIDCRMAKVAVGEGITRSVFKVKGVDLGEEEALYWTTLGKTLKNKLRKLKRKNIVNSVVSKPNATLAPRMSKLDIEPISPRLENNKDAHEVYIKKTIEYADTLRRFVEHARTQYPSEPLLESACMFTKNVQKLLVYASQTCPNSTKLSEKLVVVTPINKDKRVRFVEPVTSSSNIPKQTDSLKTKYSNKPLLTSTGVKPTTSVSGSNPSGNTKNNRITRPPRSNQNNKVEDHPRTVKSSLNMTNSISEPISCPDHPLGSGLWMFKTYDREPLSAHELRYTNPTTATLLGSTKFFTSSIKHLVFFFKIHGSINSKASSCKIKRNNDN